MTTPARNPLRSGAPSRAMVLAAGLGLRMRPITDHLPKPLVEIAGRSLLDRILDKLAEAGVGETIVNTFHLGYLIEEHLADRNAPPRIRISKESVLLETGGGIANALPLLGHEPFFVINGDVLWTDDVARPALACLAEAWDGGKADALLLLQPRVDALGYDGPGDFFLDDHARPVRRGERPSAPFIYAGLQILHPRLFRDAAAGPFSLNILYDRAIAEGRLFAVVHSGGWCHVGTPQDIPCAETFLATREADERNESCGAADTVR